MRRYTETEERHVRDQAEIRGWKGAGLIDASQAETLLAGCRVELKRTNVLIKPNNARVLVRPFEFADSQRALRIVARVMSLTETEVGQLVDNMLTEFHGRHQKARQFMFGNL